MFILYTDRPQGEWKPWATYFTPLDVRMIIDDAIYKSFVKAPVSHCIVHGIKHLHRESDGTILFVPEADTLPVFYSLLLPTAARWDVANRTWSFYVCGDRFKDWWKTYIANFKPSEEPEERKYWWLDQGPGWSVHGVKGEHGTSLFSERQERGCSWDKHEIGFDSAEKS